MNFGERFGLLAVLAVFVGGCSSMASENDTYNTVVRGLDPSDSSASAGGTDGTGDDTPLTAAPPWDCLTKSPPTLMVARPTGTTSRILYRVPIVDFDTQTAIPDLVVQACYTSDCEPVPACPSEAPGATEFCAVVSSAGPIYTINLPWMFDGGLKLTKDPEYAEMDYFFGGPLQGSPDVALDQGGNTVVGLPIPVLKLAARQRAYNEVGAGPVDTSRGTLAVRTLNCMRSEVSTTMPLPIKQGTRAAGVALQALGADPTEDGAISWTISDRNQFTANRLVTDPRGVAGFLNARPVVMDVQAELPDGTTFGLASLRVRANVITLAELRPGLSVWGQ